RNLRRSRNGRNIDAAPTDVVQQIVGHAEAGSNARLGFPKRIPGHCRARSKEPLGAIFREQRIANSRLRQKHAIGSLNEAGGQVVLRMITVRKLVANSQTQGDVVLELHRVLHKPRSHPHSEGNQRRRLGYLTHCRSALQEACERGEVCLAISSAQVAALKPFQAASHGDGGSRSRDAKIVLLSDYVVYVGLVVSSVRPGTSRSNRGITLRTSNVDLPRRFSNDEWLYSCRRYG